MSIPSIPETARERRKLFASLDRPTLIRMLSPLVRGARLVSASLLSEAHGNVHFRLALVGQREQWIVRIYARDAAACRKELAVLRKVRGRVPTPELLHAEPEGGYLGWPYAIFRADDGVPLAEVLARGTTAEIAQAAAETGRTLAAIETFRYEAAGFLDEHEDIVPFGTGPGGLHPFVAFIDAALGVGLTRQRLGAEFADSMRLFARNHAHRLPSLAPPASLVHGDFKPSNIIMVKSSSGSLKVGSVIDWEFAHAGTPFTDLGYMLRTSDSLDGAFERGLTDGYRSGGGQLPDDWKRRVRLVDAVNLIDVLGQDELSPNRAEEAVRLLKATVAEG